MFLPFETQVAEQNKDVQLVDFVESEFLAEQVKFLIPHILWIFFFSL